jgi:hypothetical protein
MGSDFQDGAAAKVPRSGFDGSTETGELLSSPALKTPKGAKKMPAGKTLLKGFIIIVIGALLGTMVGELLGAYLPDGAVKNFFLKSIRFGLEPAALDLQILTLTFGLILKINVLTVIGIIAAGVILYRL